MITLNNGISIPELGAGTYPYKEELIKTVPDMLEVGYRLIDTSDNYSNEEDVGKALESVEKDILDEIMIVTKYSYPQENVRKACDNSRKRIFSGTKDPDRKIDIYLMHWPYPYLWKKRWRQMEDLYLSGECKVIGVCNFTVKYMQEMIRTCRVKPMINQLECHPMFQQKETVDFCKNEGIQIMSYSPLARMNRDLMENTELNDIAEKYNKNEGQVILRWNIQHGLIPIPASKSMSHLRDNYSIFDFALSDEEMDRIDSLERGMRIRLDPDTRFNKKTKIRYFFYSLNKFK